MPFIPTNLLYLKKKKTFGYILFNFKSKVREILGNLLLNGYFHRQNFNDS